MASFETVEVEAETRVVGDVSITVATPQQSARASR